MEVLTSMASESVHCCVTSPPYWGLRSYQGEPGMIGLEPSFEEHLENLVEVFREVRRVLRKDGTLWLNYGDAYASNSAVGGGKPSEGEPGRPTDQSRLDAAKATSVIARAKGSGLKPKDLLMMPARVAMAFRDDGAADVRAMRTIERIGHELADEYRAADEELPALVRRVLDRLAEEYAQAKGDSWWLRSEIIWHKPNPMPESVTDRPTSAHEKLFLLSKSAKYFYDAEAVRETQSLSTLERFKNGDRSPLNKQVNKEGGSARNNESFTAATTAGILPNGRNIRNVWKIATHSFKEAHFATFPPKLVEPCIKAGTSEKGCCAECGAPWVREISLPTGTKAGMKQNSGDGRRIEGGQMLYATYKQSETTGWSPTCDHNTDPVPCVCLDPFSGAGTVGLVAQRLNRDAVLIEISPEYAEMSRKRIHGDMPLFSDVKVVAEIRD